MQKIFFTFLLLFSSTAHAWTLSDTNTSQVLVVVTDSWSATGGKLLRFEKDSTGFKKIGKDITVSVGKGGLGWGLGLHPQSSEEPQKNEGDKRAPAGVFTLGKSYGVDANPPAAATWPYAKSTGDDICIDDKESSYYNTFQKISAFPTPLPWKSKETILRTDHLYNRLLVVEHNLNPIKGRGSCIFLHIWRTPGSPTVGCTAMDQKDLETIISWLKPEMNPVLVQLTRAEYQKKKAEWNLP